MISRFGNYLYTKMCEAVVWKFVPEARRMVEAQLCVLQGHLDKLTAQCVEEVGRELEERKRVEVGEDRDSRHD